MNNNLNKSQSLVALSPKWERANTLWGGTDAVHLDGTTYLFPNPLEAPERYADRLRRATVNNAFYRTIKKSVGKAFASEMELVVPSPMEYLLENCDRSGTSYQTFAKNTLEETLKFGIYYILVDAPDTKIKSLYEQNLYNVKPFLIGITPLQVNIIETDIINNELILIKFNYNYQVDDKLLNSDYELVGGKVYCVIRDDEDNIVDEYELNLSRIPIVPVYGNKVAPYIGSPVLDEQIQLIFKHYNMQSEVENNQRYGLTPILQLAGAQQQADATTGRNNLDNFQLGASTLVKTSEQGALAWTVADSAGILAGYTSLDRIIKEIDNSGLELTVRSDVAETATGRRLDAAESNSILKSIVLDLEWSLDRVLGIVGEYLNVDTSETDVNIDTSYTIDSSTDLQILIQLFEKGILTLQEVRTEIKAMRFMTSEQVIQNLN